MTAAQALATWGTKENVPNLIGRLEKDDREVRAAVIKALAQVRDPRAIAPIAQRLTNDEDRTHGGVIAALQAFGGEAESTVVPYLSSQSTPVKRAACQVLAVIGSGPSIEALNEAIAHDNPLVRESATAALKAIRARLDKATEE
jgi:HEAT repeat protein